MQVLLKLISRFSETKIQAPINIFVKTDKQILKLMWKLEGYRILTTILQMKNKVGGFTQTDVKTYSKARIIMIMLYWQKYKQTDEQNRIAFRNKPTQRWSTAFQQRHQWNSVEKQKYFQQMTLKNQESRVDTSHDPFLTQHTKMNLT